MELSCTAPGLRGVMQREEEISTVLGVLPARFHLELEGGDGPTLAEFFADPERMLDWLDEDAALVGAPNVQVAASMLVQHTAMILGGATLAAALLCGVLPIAPPGSIRVAPGGGSERGATRWRFALEEAEFETGSAEALLARWMDEWIGGVLDEMVDATHRSVRVGRQMLADNVLSAAAANLVFLDWWEPSANLGRLAPELSSLGSPKLGERVSFSTIVHGEREGLRSARRSCCLHFQCDPAHWCPTCPKLDEGEQERIMRTHLGHLDAVVARRS